MIGKGSGNGQNVRRPWELLHFLEMPAQIEQFMQEVSTSAACFFAAARFFAAAAGEPLLVFGLAKPFWGLAKDFWVANSSSRALKLKLLTL